MKSLQIFRIFFSMLLLGAIISCDKDTDEEDNSQAISNAELRLAAQVDNTEDQSFSIVENAYVETEEVSRSSVNSFFSNCASITVTPDGNGGGSIEVDFGTGCTLQNGAEVTGKVLLTYGAIQNQSRTITYTYDNFTYNDNNVSGGGTLIRQLQNDNGNPQSLLNANVGVYFPVEDVVATRTLTRTREWIEGVGSGTWSDNVFSVIGNWNTTFSSGFNREGTVTTALRREASCPNFVSGTIDIVQNNREGVLDFGDGNCDAIATVTVGGQTYTIQL
jgi:hypothetical protein